MERDYMNYDGVHTRHNGEWVHYKDKSVIKHIPFTYSGEMGVSMLMSEQDLTQHIRSLLSKEFEEDDILVPNGSILQEHRYKITIDSIERVRGDADPLSYYWKLHYRVVTKPYKLVKIDEDGNELESH